MNLGPIEIFFSLIALHFICDYTLQSDAIATGKNRTIEYAKFGVPWFYWMTAHAATHGFAVGLFTQNYYLGIFEFLAHFLIDSIKCEKLISLHTDQALHFICKLAWVVIILFEPLKILLKN